MSLAALSRKTVAMKSLPTSAETTPSARWRWPSVHPEGRKFAVISGAITIAAFWLLPDLFGWLMTGVTIWVCAFFRDPLRSVPQAKGLIVAPADGLITMIVETNAPRELIGDGGLSSDPYTRVSIFMSVFDVHINRAPIAGRIKRIAYVPGKFVKADLDKASAVIALGVTARSGMPRRGSLMTSRS